MSPSKTADRPEVLLTRAMLGELLRRLRGDGYTVIGPTVRDGAIVYAPVESLDELPRGWSDEQGPGTYRLRPREDDALFGYVVGPHSWKQFLFPPAISVGRSERTAAGWAFQSTSEPPPKFAFLGVRACELAALAVQDRVFDNARVQDPIYAARRRECLVIAVHCTQAAATCFCSSMGTGPECHSGFDVALTEVGGSLVAQAGSEAGGRWLRELAPPAATEADTAASAAARQRAAEQISRRMPREGLRDLLLANLEHPRWSDVAERCLSCANCTMVCPTCFCSSVEEHTDLRGDSVQRRRVWDSCFNVDFSHVAGGPIRNTIRARYRQWLTHKLATWHDQFGTSGCVGCGRCITWCPVGIDLTAEVAALRGQTP